MNLRGYTVGSAVQTFRPRRSGASAFVFEGAPFSTPDSEVHSPMVAIDRAAVPFSNVRAFLVAH
jgi:hypothetical protein